MFYHVFKTILPYGHTPDIQVLSYCTKKEVIEYLLLEYKKFKTKEELKELKNTYYNTDLFNQLVSEKNAKKITPSINMNNKCLIWIEEAK